MALVTTEQIESVPGIPDEGDIADPVVPPGALAPLPSEDVMQRLRDDMRTILRGIDAGMDRLPGLLETHMTALTALLTQQKETISASEAGALQHLVDTLDTLGARGLVVSGAPYSAAIQSVSPAGYPLTLRIERQDGAAFFAALAGMETWLKESGYTISPVFLAC